MFRFGFRSACPQNAFAQGAKSVFYMNQFMSRRHCSRMRSPFVFGQLDPKMFAASNVLVGSSQSASGLVAGAAGEGSGAVSASSTAMSELMSSLAMLEELMNAAAFRPNWSVVCSFPDWHVVSNTFLYIVLMPV